MSDNVNKTDSAKKNDDAKKSQKTPKKKKFSIKRLFSNIARYFRELIAEIKKIVWPDLRTVVKNTGVVLAVCLIVGVVIWILDGALGWGVNALLQM